MTGADVCPTAPATSPPTTAAASPPAGGSTYYANCAAVRAAGAAPIHRGEPEHRSGLDRDRDRVACEQTSTSRLGYVIASSTRSAKLRPGWSNCKAATMTDRPDRQTHPSAW